MFSQNSRRSALWLTPCQTLRRQEKQVLEADEAIISIIKQMSMHSMRFQFNFEASRKAEMGFGRVCTACGRPDHNLQRLRRVLNMQWGTFVCGSARPRCSTRTKSRR